MKATLSLFAVALAAHLPPSAEVGGVEKAIASALSWHYRWIDPMPRDLASIECSVALFEERSFAYCEPTLLSMDIETAEQQPPRVINITYEHWDFERALADFRDHRNRTGRPLGPVQRISIPLSVLGACKVDRERTAWASATALPKQPKTEFERRGVTLRYPLMCEGDPFYLVYLMSGGRTESVWLFQVYPDRLKLDWTFDSGTHQRKIPKLAVDNLKKEHLWYEVH